MATQTPAYVDAGLRSLRWLMTLQTTPTGHFRPVGTDELRRTAATAARVRSAAGGGHRDDLGLPRGVARGRRCRLEGRCATRAFAWFLGSNDLSVPLVDPETGSCRDGLHPDRANENRGGESVVSYLLASPKCASLRASASSRDTPAARCRAIGA